MFSGRLSLSIRVLKSTNENHTTTPIGGRLRTDTWMAFEWGARFTVS